MTRETRGAAGGYFLSIPQPETTMGGYRNNRNAPFPRQAMARGMLLILCLTVAACTADPDAPVNQITPIRQMDRFFNSMSGPPAPPDYGHQPDYEHQPGYAPAYPAY
jgi:hypothetical protein